MTTLPAIRLEGLEKTFGKGTNAVRAVRGLDLTVDAGQVFGFLGPNGAGKSTTIRMVMQLIRPTAGRVALFGRWAQEDSRVLREVGALVEGARFYDHLSGRRNLEVLARTSGRFDRSEVEHLLARVGMADRAHRPVGGYSTGMKQRLGVAAALLGNPRLVILDEPTNGLDPAGIRDMRRFARQLVDRDGLTVFLSSHLLSEVEQICDRVAIVRHGQIVRQGTVDELVGGQSTLRLRVGQRARALEALGSHGLAAQDSNGEADGDPNLVTLDAAPEAAPEILRTLVAAGVDVLELTPTTRSLEELFLDLTVDGDETAEEPPAEAEA